MKKLILIIIILLLFMTGCGKLKKVVEVTFHINEEQEIVACEYGIIINKSYISIYNEDEIEGIYYDKEFQNKYDNKQIYENIDLYIKLVDLNTNNITRVGNIYTLEEAYDNNFLNIENIKQIQNNINDYCVNNETYANIIEGIYPCEWISEELIRQIISDKENQLNPECEGCLEFEIIKKYFIYFGTFNDCIVFRAEGCGLRAGTSWGVKVYIEDILITIPEGPYVYVWKPIEND